MIAIVDYGVGNLFSLKSSFAAIGVETVVSGDEKILKSADKIILPGVGAFSDAAAKLKATGLDAFLKEQAASGKPLMGICLGMQMLFDRSYEYGCHEGLGLIPGEVRPISEVIPNDLKIPHIGWNALKFTENKTEIFKYINDGDHVYFVHSFYGTKCESYVTANAEYGAPLCASVQKDNVYGCQFHPEKSGKTGLAILKGFCDL
ncbi:MAG: imidazole glycerol phosphate synthase subunit HisH [Ruminococcaceae bacterium]|nr:imidazole glycerol phosphate synthase subunit HisH [Oscillospiraceae bacterium]